MDFIFMLTRHDRTIEDCLELFDLIRPLGLRHVGFKDIGVSENVLRRLTDRIRASGATVYMEVVSTSPEACLKSAETARRIGVDCLLGGTQVKEIREIVAGTNIGYYPFPGTPFGHPTKLAGSIDEVERQCSAFMAQGCAGADLLAYRATDADPVELVRAARRGLGTGRLVVAGSIDTIDRMRAIAAAGADAFTIGSAIFSGTYSPQKGSVISQLADVMADSARLRLEQAA